MNTFGPIETIAGIFMTGAHLCIRDDGEVGAIATPEQAELIREAHLMEHVGRHHNEIRVIVYEGIGQIINGYTPALDGLERMEV